MARKHETLRYLVFFDNTLCVTYITVPNVPEKGSSRHAWLMSLLDLFVQLAVGHGSNKETDAEGNVYWEAKFLDHEAQSVLNWFTWHNQYEKVDTRDQLWVLPVKTDDKGD